MVDVAHLVGGRVGVLDVGMYTTDLILVDSLEYIEAGSGPLEVGVSTVLEMLRKLLLDDYRVSYEPTSWSWPCGAAGWSSTARR